MHCVCTIIEELSGFNVNGGAFQRGIRTLAACKSSCTGTCRSLDFDSNGNTCWFHTSICRQTNRAPTVTHVKYVSCGMLASIYTRFPSVFV